MSSALLCVLPLVPQKPSGGFWSFATAGWLWLEMRTMKQVLALLVLEQLPTILSQEIHNSVQNLHPHSLPRSCESFKIHADRGCETEGRE